MRKKMQKKKKKRYKKRLFTDKEYQLASSQIKKAIILRNERKTPYPLGFEYKDRKSRQ